MICPFCSFIEAIIIFIHTNTTLILFTSLSAVLMILLMFGRAFSHVTFSKPIDS